MTINYTDDDVNSKGQLNIKAIGTEDYQVDLTVPVNLSIGASVRGDGVINLGSGDDLAQSSSNGDIVINLGAGNDAFNQRTGGVNIDVTGGPGNDLTYNLGGATANFNYDFTPQITSGDGHDAIKGFLLGRDTLTFEGAGGVVNEGNFSRFFTVSDPAGSAGLVITDNQGDGWSVQLIGVHATAQQLLDGDAFVFA
jgi:hypothetical protein